MSGITPASCSRSGSPRPAATSCARTTCSVPTTSCRRPLLRALQHPGPRPAVLLIDEIDRADDDFEAFLLELLAEATVTIPELGTVTATHPPVIVLTSNRTRDLHDAVKRRCLYQWIDYPSAEREVEIIRRRVKGASATLAVQVADAVSRMRESDVQKPPGIAEAIDWLAALDVLGVPELDVRGDGPHAGIGAQVPRGSGGRPRRRPGQAGERPALRGSVAPEPSASRRCTWICRAWSATFGRRLHEAGLPVSAERSARFARALSVVRPVARRRLYWTARAVFVSDPRSGQGLRCRVRRGLRPAAHAAAATDSEDVRQIPLGPRTMRPRPTAPAPPTRDR